MTIKIEVASAKYVIESFMWEIWSRLQKPRSRPKPYYFQAIRSRSKKRNRLSEKWNLSRLSLWNLTN